MKTAKQTTSKFPKPGRFFLYMGAVMVLCFFNWVVLHAQPGPEANTFNSQLVIALAEEDEPPLKLQDWMLDFDNGCLAADEDPEIKIEPWMLSFNHDCMAGTDESEIGVEPWMVNFEQRCLVVDDEQEFCVELWMVSTDTWKCGARYLTRKC